MYKKMKDMFPVKHLSSTYQEDIFSLSLCYLKLG